MNNNKNITIGLSIIEGAVARNILENNFINLLFDKLPLSKIIIFTPAYSIDVFKNKWVNGEKVSFHPLIPFEISKNYKRINHVRKLFIKYKFFKIAKLIKKYIRLNPANKYYYKKAVEELDLLICGHVHHPHEAPIANLSYSKGITVIGFLNSWDNVFKGINTHVDKILVWNEINKTELKNIEGYQEDEVAIVGAHSFTLYHDRKNKISKKEFCQSLNLDENKPILTYATCGNFFTFIEETFILEEIIQYCSEIPIGERPQIICRLHPWTKKEFFKKYLNENNITFSSYENYIPTLNWSPTKEETIFAGNLLRHSSICITPGSTMVLEAVLFNTPVIIPFYNDYQQEVWDMWVNPIIQQHHWKYFFENNFGKIIYNRKDFFSEITKYLNNRNEDKEQRENIIKEYIDPSKNAIKNAIDIICSELKNK